MLKIKDMNSNSVIRQGDSQPREYQLDTGNLDLNLTNRSATIRLMTADFQGIGYETTATVSSENKISFSIDDVIPAREYRLEITVDDYVFPSRATDGRFDIDPSSHGQEVNIIQVIGKDEIVREVKEQIEPFLGEVEQAELDRQAQEEARETAEGERQEEYQKYGQQFTDVITELSEEKDYHSLPEIAGARGGFDTLGDRLNETTAQLAQKASRTDLKKTDAKAEGANQRIDNLTIPLSPENSNIEVTNAKTSVTKGKSFDLLGHRLDESERETLRLIEQTNLKVAAHEINGILYATSLEFGLHHNFPSSFVYFVEVSPGEYFFNLPENDSVTHTRIAFFDKLPENIYITSPIQIINGSGLLLGETTITIEQSGFLALMTNTNGVDTPFILLEKNNEAYTHAILKENSVEMKHTDFIKKTKNMFDERKYIKGAIVRNEFRNDSHFLHTNVHVVEIEPFKTYTITPQRHPMWDRFRALVFDEIPTENNQMAVQTIITENDMPESVTFTNGMTGRYLLLYLNSTGDEIIPTQVEEGTESTEYEEYGFLIDDFNIKEFEVTPSNNDEVYFNIESLPMSYKPSVFYDVTPTGDFNLVESIHTDIYSIYDNLVGDYGDWTVSKAIVGEDDFGNNINEYTFKPKPFDSDTEISYTKILLTTGVHGNEKTFPYSVAKFFEDMRDKWREEPMLDWLRHNVEFKILPVATPTGFDDNTRPNRNGVNINRNFELNWTTGFDGTDNYGGPEPFSEPETRTIRDWIDANLDAEFYIDCHNMADRAEDVFIWLLTFVVDEEYKNFANRFSSTLSRRWAKRYDWVPEKNIGYTSTISGAATNTYAIQNGIKSYTLEIDYSIKFYSDGRRFNPMNIAIAMEYFGSYIVALLKEMKGKEAPSV